MNKKWYQSALFMWVMLVFFFPIGLFLLWRYSEYSKKAKIIITAFFVILTFISLSGNKNRSNSANNQPTVKQEQTASSSSSAANSAKQDEQNKKAASQEITNILGNVAQKYDEVDHKTEYTSWGNGNIPAKRAIYWQLSVSDDKKISDVYINIVDFTTNTTWTFWSTMTFSNGNDKWSKKLDTFAGQSGDGKNTQVVTGGKYEMWQGTASSIKNGLDILASGGDNPILRLSGNEYKTDMRLNPDDVDRVKTALHLLELREITGNTLTN